MAITDDRDVRDAIWYATDAIGNRLQNDSMYIEKVRKNLENLRDNCYNVVLDNDRGLGEQKCYVWENLDLKEPMLPGIKIQPSKLDTKIPTRKDIYDKISSFTERHYSLTIFIYTYEFNNGLKFRTEAAIDSCKMNDAGYRIREKTKAINELIDRVLKHYNDERSKEEYGMTGAEFKKNENDIRMINDKAAVEGMARSDCTPHIEMPLEHLKYIKVVMPPTNFCVSMRTDADNWIERLPAVKRVDVYNDRVVKVTFIDDTFTKSVCSENDHFDLDVGISICCMKRLLGKDGNKIYNDIIRHAHKVMLDNNKKRELEEKQKAERKLKVKRDAGKKAAKKLLAKQEQIDIQTQAIIQAHDALEARHSEA